MTENKVFNRQKYIKIDANNIKLNFELIINKQYSKETKLDDIRKDIFSMFDKIYFFVDKNMKHIPKNEEFDYTIDNILENNFIYEPTGKSLFRRYKSVRINTENEKLKNNAEITVVSPKMKRNNRDSNAKSIRNYNNNYDDLFLTFSNFDKEFKDIRNNKATQTDDCHDTKQVYGNTTGGITSKIVNIVFN